LKNSYSLEEAPRELINEVYINYSFFFKKMKGAYIERFEITESIFKFSLKKLASK